MNNNEIFAVKGKPKMQLDSIPIFVYGSLFLNNDSSNELKPFILESKEDVYVFGELYESTAGNWPLLKSNGDRRILGKYLVLSTDDFVMSKIFKEELLFGYDITWQSIYNMKDSVFLTKALVCTWNSEVFLGKLVLSNNWSKR